MGKKQFAADHRCELHGDGKTLVLDYANNFIHSEIDNSEADIYDEGYICKDDDEVRPARSRRKGVPIFQLWEACRNGKAPGTGPLRCSPDRVMPDRLMLPGR